VSRPTPGHMPHGTFAGPSPPPPEVVGPSSGQPFAQAPFPGLFILRAIWAAPTPPHRLLRPLLAEAAPVLPSTLPFPHGRRILSNSNSPGSILPMQLCSTLIEMDGERLRESSGFFQRTVCSRSSSGTIRRPGGGGGSSSRFRSSPDAAPLIGWPSLAVRRGPS